MSDAQTAVGLAEQWLYTVLHADSMLAGLLGSQIYTGVAPEGATYPMVVAQSLGGDDTTAMAMQRVLTQFRYVVHCADRVGSILGLDAIAARVDALIHGQQGYAFASGARMLACVREWQGTISQQVAGVQTREITSRYLIIMQEIVDT